MIWFDICSSHVKYYSLNKQSGCRVRPTRYAPPVCCPDLWPFDLQTGVRVASKVRNLRSKFGRPRPLGSRIIMPPSLRSAENAQGICATRYTLSHNQFGQLLIRWYDLSGLFQVIGFGSNRNGFCDHYLLMNNSNFGRILHRFRHNCIAFCKIADFTYPAVV